MQQKWQWWGSIVAMMGAIVLPGKALSSTPFKTPPKTPIAPQERRVDELNGTAVVRTSGDRDALGRDRDALGRDRDALGREQDALGRDRDILGRDRDARTGCPKKTGGCYEKGEFEFEGFEYWVDACHILERQGDYAGALEACETAIELEPNKRETIDVWASRGNALVGLERHEEAIASYNRVLAARPEDSRVWTSQCEALLELGQTEDGIAACDRAIDANGNWGRTTPARAWRFRARGYRQQADSIIDGLETEAELAELFPDRPQDGEAQTRESNQLFYALIEANRSYERAIDLEPRDSLARARQCGILTQLGWAESPTPPGYPPQPTPAERYKLAIETCREAISIDGDWGDRTPALAWGNLALARVALGELETRFVEKARYFEAAIATYEKALEIDPLDAPHWTEQGRLLQQLGRHEKALISFDRALEIAPDASLALVHRCELLNAIEKHQEALEACEGALDGDNHWDGEAVARVWNQRAAALVGLADYEGALASVERALALYDVPDRTAAILLSQDPIGRCHKLDLAAISQRDFDGSWDGYRNALNNKAAILWHLGRNLEARRWAIGALSPESVAIESAVDEQGALEISCNASSAWFNYGRILQELEDYPRAIEAYDFALKTYGIYRSPQVHSDRSLQEYSDRSLQEHSDRSPQVYSEACAWLLKGGQTKTEKATNPIDGGGAFYAIPDRYCANIWVNQSAVFYYRGRYLQARNAAENATHLYPESIAAWYNLALASVAQGQYREALNAFDRAQGRIGQENGELADRIVAGQVKTIADWGEEIRRQASEASDGNQARELYQTALNLFDRALELDPDYTRVQQAQSEILNAMLQLEVQPILVNPQVNDLGSQKGVKP